MELLNSLKTATVLSGLVLATACTPQNQQQLANVDGHQSGIIGGTNVETSDVIAKSTVLLQIYTKSAEGEESFAGCTGTLIREDIVLTAAHCVPEVPKGGKGIVAVIFSTSAEQAMKDKQAGKDVARYVLAPLVHPGWKGNEEKSETASSADVAEKGVESTTVDELEEDPNSNDLALFKLNAPAPAGFVPVKLLSDEKPLLKEGVEVIIAGFGLNSDVLQTNDGHLKKAKTHVLSPYGDVELVTDQSNGQSVCSGDSGGPAFIEVNGEIFQWGVASRVGNGENRKAYCSGVAVHGRVAPQARFITKGMAFLDEVTKKK